MKELVQSYFDIKSGERFAIGSYSFMRRKQDGVYLFAPIDYWTLTDDGKKALGCGPGKWGDALVPDSIFGLSIQPACGAHDISYALGETEEDKMIADILFLMNMLSIVHTKSWPVIRQVRSYRAMTYYLAVEEHGEAAFWKGKKKP